MSRAEPSLVPPALTPPVRRLLPLAFLLTRRFGLQLATESRWSLVWRWPAVLIWAFILLVARLQGTVVANDRAVMFLDPQQAGRQRRFVPVLFAAVLGTVAYVGYLAYKAVTGWPWSWFGWLAAAVGGAFFVEFSPPVMRAVRRAGSLDVAIQAALDGGASRVYSAGALAGDGGAGVLGRALLQACDEAEAALIVDARDQDLAGKYERAGFRRVEPTSTLMFRLPPALSSRALAGLDSAPSSPPAPARTACQPGDAASQRQGRYLDHG